MWESVTASMTELRRWLPWAVDGTKDEARAFAKTCEKDWDENRAWTFAIISEDEVVGTIGLMDAEPQTKRAELGYWMRTADAGQGLMSEAAEAVIQFGFSQLGLHRIELEAGVDNLASIKVAEKLGFQREGLARESGWAGIGYYDTVRFGLLSTDPRPYEQSGARV
jgi:ribosomal-protein-serine acetyltransferase